MIQLEKNKQFYVKYGIKKNIFDLEYGIKKHSFFFKLGIWNKKKSVFFYVENEITFLLRI